MIDNTTAVLNVPYGNSNFNSMQCNVYSLFPYVMCIVYFYTMCIVYFHAMCIVHFHAMCIVPCNLYSLFQCNVYSLITLIGSNPEIVPPTIFYVNLNIQCYFKALSENDVDNYEKI